MSEATTGPGRAIRLFKTTLIWMLVLGLLAVVGYLLCERNARTFAFEQRGGDLWVMRGRFLPAGLAPYTPADRVFARAYAPLPAAGEPLAGLDLTARYADRDQLDRALFKVLKEMVEVRTGAEEPERLREAVVLLGRAELLGGVAEEQRSQLKDLQARVAFFEGSSRLDEAVVSLRLAVEKLKLASDTVNRHSESASELHERIATLADQISRAARQPLAAVKREEEGEGAVGVESSALPAESAVPAPAPPAHAVAPEVQPESPRVAPGAQPEAPAEAAPDQNR